MEDIEQENTTSHRYYVSLLTNKLKEKGIRYRVGRWSKKETAQLRENWNQFFEEHKFASPLLLLRKTQASKHERPEIAKFIQHTNFYKKLAKGLARPVYGVYIRARTIFHANNTSGRFSDEELKQIGELQTKYGVNKWTRIGQDLGRSGIAIHGAHRRAQCLVKGPWAKEEEEKLVDALREVSGCNDLSEVSHLMSWEDVARFVPGRSARQCRDHWLYQMHATYKNGNSTGVTFTDNDRISLIQLICDQNVHDESDIDWCSLIAAFPSVPSVFYLKDKWYQLKRRVAGHSNKSLDDILDDLALNAILKLRGEDAETQSAELALTDDGSKS